LSTTDSDCNVISALHHRACLLGSSGSFSFLSFCFLLYGVDSSSVSRSVSALQTHTATGSPSLYPLLFTEIMKVFRNKVKLLKMVYSLFILCFDVSPMIFEKSPHHLYILGPLERSVGPRPRLMYQARSLEVSAHCKNFFRVHVNSFSRKNEILFSDLISNYCLLYSISKMAASLNPSLQSLQVSIEFFHNLWL